MSDKNQLIKELIEHNDELENYFRNTIIPQLYIDGELKLQKFTPPAMKQFSLTASDIGKPIADVKDNLRFPSILDNIEQVIESNEILEKEIQTTDLRWYQMNIIPYVKRRDKTTDGVIITFVEITRRIKDLQEQEKLIADHEILLDTISHDIRSPLTSLVMAIELFKEVSPNEEKQFQSLLKVVDSAVTTMHKLIGELTEIRKETHKYQTQEELLNFEHILEDVRLTLYNNIIAANAILTSEINVSEIAFSRRKLRTIIYNLVNNAVKFKSPERQPEIVITTNREDDYIIISVKDNGIGVDERKFEAIFSKYYRVENAIEGSGIGLYLVKEIVNNAGGKVVLESQLGKGSEFKVYLKIE
ncbi:MAG: sensor protein for response regulator AtoC [Ferruginibacter sp.]|uniref:sensor histidine kinase n=1 Tax=Ferruginibacter sp. TaxID=1940288 RepID=UPI00265AF955|nr:ATP-binding protein [Ferruginibacter sp.]MDB5280634.1 sensor protein for response regulator AtoC [Ferruginibacter sp.]